MAMNWEIQKRMVNELAETIKAHGFRVFVHLDVDNIDYFGFFTNGKNVAYFGVVLDNYCIGKCTIPSVSVCRTPRLSEITKDVCDKAISSRIPNIRGKFKPRLYKLDELLNRYKNSEYFKEI